MSTLSESLNNASKLVRHAIGSALSGIHAGDEKIASRQSDTAGPSMIRITSDAFSDGQPVPERYTPQGENVSPQLSWSGIPTGTQELVLIVEDPDAPFPNPFVHWILHGLTPDVASLPAGLPNTARLTQLGAAVQGINGGKTAGWTGPTPPMGHGVHHYHFQLFALDKRLHLGAEATLDELKKAMGGHVLGDGELIGTFERTASTK